MKGRERGREGGRKLQMEGREEMRVRMEKERENGLLIFHVVVL